MQQPDLSRSSTKKYVFTIHFTVNWNLHDGPDLSVTLILLLSTFPFSLLLLLSLIKDVVRYCLIAIVGLSSSRFPR